MEKEPEETIVLSEEDFNKIKSSLENVAKNFTPIAISLNAATQNIVKNISEFVAKLAPQIQEAMQSLAKLPDELEKIQKALAEHGWFIIPGIPVSNVRALEAVIDAGDFDAVDKEMISWVYTLLDETEVELCRLYPHREAILKEGFENHRAGRYASAITLLLTQADGICYDLFNKVFFILTKYNAATPHVPQISPDIDALGLNPFAKLTLNPILERSGINAWETEIAAGAYPNSPHRHPIMHGKDTTYPTELNSWKIISFLAYMGDFVRSVKNSVGTP